MRRRGVPRQRNLIKNVALRNRRRPCGGAPSAGLARLRARFARGEAICGARVWAAVARRTAAKQQVPDNVSYFWSFDSGLSATGWRCCWNNLSSDVTYRSTGWTPPHARGRGGDRHERAAKQAAASANVALEQQHQAQTQALAQRHTTEQRTLEETQQTKPEGKVAAAPHTSLRAV